MAGHFRGVAAISVARWEDGDHPLLLYAENATMQENGAEPRVGKDALLKYEEAAQASVTDLKSRCIRPILVAGDVAVIRWVFEPSLHPDGKRPRGLRGADVLKAVEQGVNTLFNGRV